MLGNFAQQDARQRVASMVPSDLVQDLVTRLHDWNRAHESNDLCSRTATSLGTTRERNSTTMRVEVDHDSSSAGVSAYELQYIGCCIALLCRTVYHPPTAPSGPRCWFDCAFLAEHCCRMCSCFHRAQRLSLGTCTAKRRCRGGGTGPVRPDGCQTVLLLLYALWSSSCVGDQEPTGLSAAKCCDRVTAGETREALLEHERLGCDKGSTTSREFNRLLYQRTLQIWRHGSVHIELWIDSLSFKQLSAREARAAAEHGAWRPH